MFHVEQSTKKQMTTEKELKKTAKRLGINHFIEVMKIENKEVIKTNLSKIQLQRIAKNINKKLQVKAIKLCTYELK